MPITCRGCLQQDLFDAMEPDIDGVKFAGGAVMAMQRSGVAQLLGVVHDNGAYAACAGGYELAVEKVRSSRLHLHLTQCTFMPFCGRETV